MARWTRYDDAGSWKRRGGEPRRNPRRLGQPQQVGHHVLRDDLGLAALVAAQVADGQDGLPGTPGTQGGVSPHAGKGETTVSNGGGQAGPPYQVEGQGCPVEDPPRACTHYRPASLVGVCESMWQAST